jgi:hypothetical protein
VSFSPFEPLTWLCAIVLGLAIALAVRGTWIWLPVALLGFAGSVIIRLADAQRTHFTTLRKGLR